MTQIDPLTDYKAIEIFCDMQTKLEGLVENMRKHKGLEHSG